MPPSDYKYGADGDWTLLGVYNSNPYIWKIIGNWYKTSLTKLPAYYSCISSKVSGLGVVDCKNYNTYIFNCIDSGAFAFPYTTDRFGTSWDYGRCDGIFDSGGADMGAEELCALVAK